MARRPELHPLRVVCLEGVPVRVPGIALKLDNEIGVGPIGIYLEAVHHVRLVRRQISSLDEVEEQPLQLGLELVRGRRVVVEEGAEPGHAAVSVAPVAELAQLAMVEDAELLGSLVGAAQLVLTDDVRQIEKRALH
jgi:hypothetical protein